MEHLKYANVGEADVFLFTTKGKSKIFIKYIARIVNIVGTDITLLDCFELS